MKIKLSKSQWEAMGKKAGWGQDVESFSDLASTTATYLKNNVVAKVLPKNMKQIQALVDQLVSAIQASEKDKQAAFWSQKPR